MTPILLTGASRHERIRNLGRHRNRQQLGHRTSHGPGPSRESLAAAAAAHPNIETLIADAANPKDAPGCPYRNSYPDSFRPCDRVSFRSAGPGSAILHSFAGMFRTSQARRDAEILYL